MHVCRRALGGASLDSMHMPQRRGTKSWPRPMAAPGQADPCIEGQTHHHLDKAE